MESGTHFHSFTDYNIKSKAIHFIDEYHSFKVKISDSRNVVYTCDQIRLAIIKFTVLATFSTRANV